MKRSVLVLMLMAALGLAPGAAAVTLRSGHGLRVTSVKHLDSRLIALTVQTSALPGPANIRILLPSGYASHPGRRYPVLYLLHGTSGGASDWTEKGDAEKTTDGKQLIVVMPDIALDDDGGGWCTNWPDGKYKWETFHIQQLIPWVDANLRTVAARPGRAIAGLSQGGFCSMSYAARHPDMFSVALAYSGAPDIAFDHDAFLLASPVINATEVGLDHVPPNSMFGNPMTNFINWAAHDPATLAPNLRWTKLFMYFGNGQPGPFDSSPVNAGAGAIEAGVHQLNIDFHNRLVSLGIPSLYDPYGNGTHSWPYWARDLRWSIGPIMHDFSHPAALPKFSYTSAATTYRVYGWKVVMHRRVREFSTLAEASAGGFVLRGSGSGTVTTPARYTPGARYRVVVGGKAGSVRANRFGRLTIAVPLGPSNTVQEYGPDGVPSGTKVYSTGVEISW
jgi:S-formylglutathione hydrolase FrmB